MTLRVLPLPISFADSDWESVVQVSYKNYKNLYVSTKIFILYIQLKGKDQSQVQQKQKKMKLTDLL